jgi:GNAT superfamily N-acetyltransferase
MARSGHVKKMARCGEAARAPVHDDPRVHTRHIAGITVRPLRNGDTATVAAVFGRLDTAARCDAGADTRHRSAHELAAFARDDRDHHVLVAYVDGDNRPAGIARLVRTGSSARIAVVEACRGQGVGSVLAAELGAAARAAGIVEIQPSTT